MKVALERINSGSEWTATDEGLLGDLLEENDRVKIAKASLRNDKRVTIVVTEEGNDVPGKLGCSTGLSDVIRKALAKGSSQEDVLASLLACPVITTTAKDGSDIKVITLPKGSLGTDFLVSLLKKKVVPAEGKKKVPSITEMLEW